MSIDRDDELLTRLGSGRPDLAGLNLDEPTRQIAVLLRLLRSDVDSEPTHPIGQFPATGRA